MPSVAVPVAVMSGLGVFGGILAHRRVRGFWRASLAGGLAGALVWMVGALVLVVPTEGLGWTGVESLYLLFKAFAIVSAITVPAAILAGFLVRRTRAAPRPQTRVEPLLPESR